MTTVAASIAVVCAVAMTTSTALVDSVGAAVSTRPVVVPTSPATPPAASASPAPVTPPAPALPVEAETVPAPEPVEISAPSGDDALAEPSTWTEEELAAAVAASGSWDVVYAWTAERGWSPARTEAWIARLEAKIARESIRKDPGQPVDDVEVNGLVAPDSTTGNRIDPLVPAEAERLTAPGSTTGDRIDPPIPAQAEQASERDLPGPAFGSKRERSQVPPD
jgi:hypothetical protein